MHKAIEIDGYDMMRLDPDMEVDLDADVVFLTVDRGITCFSVLISYLKEKTPNIKYLHISQNYCCVDHNADEKGDFTLLYKQLGLVGLFVHDQQTEHDCPSFSEFAPGDIPDDGFVFYFNDGWTRPCGRDFGKNAWDQFDFFDYNKPDE